MATFFNTWTQKEQEWNPDKPVYAVRMHPDRSKLDIHPSSRPDRPQHYLCINASKNTGIFEAAWLATGEFPVDAMYAFQKKTIGSICEINGAREYFDAFLNAYPMLRGKVQLVAAPCLFSRPDSHRVIAE